MEYEYRKFQQIASVRYTQQQNNEILQQYKSYDVKDDYRVQRPAYDDSVSSEPDFRIEIQRRFEKSIVNRIYTFPKMFLGRYQKDSLNNSFEKLSNITLVDLQVQNEERQRLEKEKREQDRRKRRQISSYSTIHERIQQGRDTSKQLTQNKSLNLFPARQRVKTKKNTSKKRKVIANSTSQQGRNKGPMFGQKVRSNIKSQFLMNKKTQSSKVKRVVKKKKKKNQIINNLMNFLNVVKTPQAQNKGKLPDIQKKRKNLNKYKIQFTKQVKSKISKVSKKRDSPLPAILQMRSKYKVQRKPEKGFHSYNYGIKQHNKHNLSVNQKKLVQKKKHDVSLSKDKVLDSVFKSKFKKIKFARTDNYRDKSAGAYQKTPIIKKNINNTKSQKIIKPVLFKQHGVQQQNKKSVQRSVKIKGIISSRGGVKSQKQSFIRKNIQNVSFRNKNNKSSYLIQNKKQIQPRPARQIRQKVPFNYHLNNSIISNLRKKPRTIQNNNSYKQLQGKLSLLLKVKDRVQLNAQKNKIKTVKVNDGYKYVSQNYLRPMYNGRKTKQVTKFSLKDKNKNLYINNIMKATKKKVYEYKRNVF